MCKAARIFGLVWMAGIAVAGIVLMVSGKSLGNGRGFLYILFGAALPGVLSYRWGSQAAREKLKTQLSRNPKATFDAAAEQGHVLRLNAAPSPPEFDRRQ